MRELITLAGEVALTAAAGGGQTKSPRLRIVAYKGGEISVPGYGRVIVDLAALEIPVKVPLLADHDQSLAAIVGSGVAEVRGGELHVAGNVAATDAGRSVTRLLGDGVPLGASVGVEPLEMRELRRGEALHVNGRSLTMERAGVLLVTRARLREVSILTVPADAGASVVLAARRGGPSKGREIMTFNEWMVRNNVAARLDRAPAMRVTLLTAAALDGAELNDVERDELLAAARDRVTADPGDELRAAAADMIRAGRRDPQLVRATLDQALEAGWNPTRLRAEVDIAASPRVDNRVRAAHPGGGPVTPRLLACATLLLLGRRGIAEKAYGADVAQAAEDLQFSSFRDLAAAAVAAGGGTPPRETGALLKAAFAPMLQAAGGPTTYDLGNVISDAAHKLALDSFTDFPQTFRTFARVLANLQNFKPHAMLKINWAQGGVYREVPRGGPIPAGVMKDSGHSIQAGMHGLYVTVDYRDLVDDDLGLLNDGPTEIGRLGARALANHVYKTWLDPTGDFFASGNGNLLSGADSALSVDSLSDAILMLRKQKDVEEGGPIGLTPKVLLVPPELETAGRALLSSITLARATADADRLPEGNPLPRDLTLEVEPRLSDPAFAGASETAWYLFARPFESLLVGFLRGMESPTIRTEPIPLGQGVGMGIEGTFSFAAARGEPKTVVKATGAAD